MALNFQTDVLPVIQVEEVDAIHARMLAVIQQLNPDLDTQLGSPAYDATRPVANEYQDIQRMIVDAVSAAIPSLSHGVYLDEHAKDVGLTRKPGDYATGIVTLEATTDLTIPAGTLLWTEDDKRFTTTEEAVITMPEVQEDPDNPAPGTAVVTIRATAVGRDHNVSPYTIRSIERAYQNLVTVRHESTMAGGVDEESDIELKGRLFARQQNQSGAGNPDNYKGWALEINGIKAANVFRAMPSPGSVTIAIASQDGVPDAGLVDAVQAHIDAKANVLANNVIVPATALPIDIGGTLTLTPDTLLADVQAAYEASVVSYLESLYYTGEPVRYSALYQLLLNTTGVLDASDFLVNGAAANILAEGTDIAVLGTVTFT
ncbi:baseplate J/gp47 family protein [Exiguobacterium sp. MMG028]|uniref:baseplate J/gp47 family protein n=1 Tax=Exiguobacterium sp. MMG028 TaxID=3021979 RepID=UPI0022FDD8D6|nr:baseplate J/gp47 family protein [Exiguobacterium sp. MMG028]MDA5561944.1 baseplate J/gp47 family protein [Exiguobacterium sp. MMG028]